MTRARLGTILILAASPLALVACGGGKEAGVAQRDVVVRLGEQNGSGESGTATLIATAANATTVVVKLAHAPEIRQPAHVHAGTCGDIDPLPAYMLNELDGGRSETTLPVSLHELRASHLVVNVHKSDTDVKTYAACGPIP
jgi:cysteine sulfinate desulfinase/cysteine desulfurase-like protein